MGPDTSSQATLVDLLDRVLDRGVVIYADIIVSVAGVPLIGINLRAALAGMETMTDYGVMKEWDESLRNRALKAAGNSRRVESVAAATAISES